MGFRSIKVKMRITTIDSLNFVFVNRHMARDEFIDRWICLGLKERRMARGFSE